MPRVYRIMLVDGILPRVGTDGNMLGVRVPPSERCDVVPDMKGYVSPNNGGLSVCPSIQAIPPTLMPRKYRKSDSIRSKSYRGDPSLEIFLMGAGDFVVSLISEFLQLVPTSAMHGHIEPTQSMLIQNFQKALADTRNDWILVNSVDGI